MSRVAPFNAARSRACGSGLESPHAEGEAVIASALWMKFSQFESMKQYVGFDETSSERLKRFLPLAEPDFTAIIDDFYAAITQHPEARAAITGGDAQVSRLKHSLVAWLRSLLLGPHDEAYLQSHSRIGRVHVRINLPQEFMFTAMSRIRTGLHETANQTLEEPERSKTRRAVDQMLDLELGIMLDTYRQDWLERVRVSERLSTIGQLAASIGHELRNPLGIVQSSIFLLEQRADKLKLEDAVIHKHLGRIASQVNACGKTISSLLDLARDNPPRKEMLLLAVVVREALSSVSQPAGIQLSASIPENLGALADRAQLRQVVTNLVNNGIEALGGEGSIQISGQANEAGVELFVKDDGPGIGEDVRDKIFDVLFTTRANGTGLGLALCRRIVQAHGGELNLVSGASGALFRVWLPGDDHAGESSS